MGLTENTMLHSAEKVGCNVHPVVPFSIIDHYSRREDGQDRVIGTLLGTEVDGVVQVCSCFPVPHTETDEQVAVNTDFHATMLQLHQRVHPKHKVVGWYSTGKDVNDASMLFHDFYGQEVERPVHLLLDLGLGDRRMSCKAYVSVGLTLGARRLGTVFEDVKLRVVNDESDQIGIDTLLKSSAGGPGLVGGSALSDVDSVEGTLKTLLRTLESVMDHAEMVTSRGAAADTAAVRLLHDLMASAPRQPAVSFEKMFNAQVQDMLTVVYLANLTRTQLALAEKLQAVALANAN